MNLVYAQALLAALVLFPLCSFAYPDFIGYGYASCLTCHTNGLGGGAINDYGRGVWAAEIASRALYPKKKSLEEISQMSGFLGDTEKLPWWIRPHFKYRGIWVQKEPKSAQQTERIVQMQFDMGASVALDQDQKYLLSITYGYVPTAETMRSGSVNNILAREYFARVQLSDNLWTYFGKLEKVFGIRNIDHTSYTRSPQELGQNTQSVGGIAHWVDENYEIALNIFTGDPAAKEPKHEQKGVSLLTEYSFMPNSRAGFSFLNSNSEAEKNIQIAAVHWRQALSKGSSIMFEYGFLKKREASSNTVNGSYTFAQTSLLLTKGYSLLLNLERYNANQGAHTPEKWRMGVGFLTFPINRVEFRAAAVHERQVSSEAASQDSWMLQGQLHVSL
ncbi:MAG: hypothetical protein ABS42_00550 [Bdellovibrio sp. SCN 50-8]|nr:MAG: hypothetical protein ABS42_00550 [Bdellovibrio sp. SCN 50-8]